MLQTIRGKLFLIAILSKSERSINYFIDRSGAIGLDELENAITNLGVDSKTVDLESIIKEADKRGNHQIDFDEFCEVMQKMTEKNRNWNEIIKECFAVFDRVFF